MLKNHTEKKFREITNYQVKDFSIEEARGFTIEFFRDIESKIDKIICDFVAPENESFFKKVILNSSILDIGSKLKIIKNIGKIDNKTIDDIRKLSSIRNGFAHASIGIKHSSFYTSHKDGVEITPPYFVTEHIISVMKSSGDIEEKNAIDYLNEFIILLQKVREKI